MMATTTITTAAADGQLESLPLFSKIENQASAVAPYEAKHDDSDGGLNIRWRTREWEL